MDVKEMMAKHAKACARPHEATGGRVAASVIELLRQSFGRGHSALEA